MTTSTAVELLGSELHSSKGAVATESLFTKDSVLGLYFGSGWCPPCKVFTSKLSTFYSSLKEKGKHHLEIVFVSSDYSQEEFVQTFATMPWLAVPFDKDKKLRLTRRYRINTLPSLVLIDPHTLRVLCRSGREMVLSDPEGIKFPWQPRSVVDVLSTTTLIDPSGQVVGYDGLKESYKALYFSAHWCPPCKAFTPVLVSTFNKVRERGEKLEVIFVSSDRSEESWQKYRSTMPWLSVAWSEEESRRELASALQVDGIPTLVLLQPDGSVLTSEGRERINEDPEGEMFPWNPQSVDTLSERHMTRLQDNPILVLFTDGEATEFQFARDVLLPVAEDYLASKCEDDGTALRFFVAGEDEISDSLREYAQLEDVVPLVAIVDLAEGTKYVLEEGVEVSTATVYNFVSRYNKGKLTPIAIRSEPEEEEESMQTS